MADIIEFPRRGLYPEDGLVREWQAARRTCHALSGNIRTVLDQQLLREAISCRRSVMRQYIQQFQKAFKGPLSA